MPISTHDAPLTSPLLSAPLLTQVQAVSEYYADYRLTWPGTQRGVCTVAGQWQRTDSGEIEAWYTAEQLRECLVVMNESVESKNLRVCSIESEH